MRIKCLKSNQIYEDCRTLKTFIKGKDYDVSEKTGKYLIESKFGEKIKGEAKPSDDKPKADDSPKQNKSFFGRNKK